MTQFLLIRHAQSQNNALHESKRVPDPAITSAGISQAEHVGEALKNCEFTQIYCSGFLRALQTTHAVAKHHQCEVEIRADIFEKGGCYSGFRPGEKRGEPGMNRSELQASYPGWKVDGRIGASGWWGSKPFETNEEAQQRAASVREWLEKLTHENANADARIALVIHADFKQLLLTEIFSSHRDFARSMGPLFNTGVTSVKFIDGDWRLNGFNATTHLPFELITS